MLRIGDVARLLDVTEATIRHWQTVFPMTVYRVGNQRRFPTESVNRLRLIKHLTRNQGYTLDGARSQYVRLINGDW